MRQGRSAGGSQVGDRVVSEQIVPCWECRYCKRGQYHMCPAAQPVRIQALSPPARWPNSWSTQWKLWCTRYPKGSAGSACRLCRAAVVLTTCSRTSQALHFDDVVVVAGCGPIGLGMVAGARAKSPAHVIALDMGTGKARARQTVRSRHRHQHRRTRTPCRSSRISPTGTGPMSISKGQAVRPQFPQGLQHSCVSSAPTSNTGCSKTTSASTGAIISDDKELDVLGAHLGPALLACRNPDDRVRPAPDGQDLHAISFRWKISRRGSIWSPVAPSP